MSVIAGVAKAAGAKVLPGRRPARTPLLRTKRTLVVMALVLFALTAFAALVPASETPNMVYSSPGRTDYQSVGATAPGSEVVAPQMSEKAALDAYVLKC
jgi:hypothetical protein